MLCSPYCCLQGLPLCIAFATLEATAVTSCCTSRTAVDSLNSSDGLTMGGKLILQHFQISGCLGLEVVHPLVDCIQPSLHRVHACSRISMLGSQGGH
eukprot:m.370090 g.370090  ORF g.370090 m.370090 type:complete len:97 (+) comp56122_c1_seq11:147-437(+)